jgi:hypothetical protein
MDQKRYHIIIASVIFALLTWFSINMRDEYTIVKQIPVVLENMKEGRALKYPLPTYVSVRLSGNGWQLAGLYLSPDVKYFIDVSTLGEEKFMITGHELLEHIKLPVALQPIDVKPETLMLALDDYREKQVRIEPRIVLEFREGYGQVGPVQFLPESIRIGGSQTMLANISGWPTVYRKFDNLHAPLDMDLPLEEPMTHSVEIFTLSTRMRMNVQPFAEKTFSGVALNCPGVPPNREVIFIPPKIDLIVRGGIDQLARLADTDFQPTISYRDLIQDSVTSVTPHLNDVDGIQVVSVKPEHVRFIIRKRL